ncbi:MAG: hypothetical protein RLZZ323_1145 [Bacteroidota bacterium]
MMNSLEDFVNNPAQSGNLYDKLRERVFLKTQLDVVYTDLVNWERSGLLSIGGDSNKGDWKKVNYTEYIWIKVIEELRKYGFNYDEIELIKQNLFEEITIGKFLQSINDDKENVVEKLGEEPLNKLNAFDFSQVDMNESSGITQLENIIVRAIVATEDWSLLFLKDTPGLCIPMSSESLRGFYVKNIINELSIKLKETYLSVSLTRILTNFLIRRNNSFESRTISILTKEEHAVLKHIRKKYKNIKSIRIRFNNNEMELLEITTLKKVQLESRFLEQIKKGDYLSISIDTVDGNIVNYENTKKYKL